jgi:hypothetical protein
LDANDDLKQGDVATAFEGKELQEVLLEQSNLENCIQT